MANDRKNGRVLLYGEETVQLNIRVPKSKKDEISGRFYSILDEYIVSSLKSVMIEEKKEVVVEVKNSISDDVLENDDYELKTLSDENKYKIKEHKQVLKFENTTSEYYDGDKAKSLLIDEVAIFPKPNIDLSKGIMSAVRNAGENYPKELSVGDVQKEADVFYVKQSSVSISDEKKAKIKELQALADGIKSGGIKVESIVPKKKPIDEIYDCILVTRGIPDISERVYASAKSDVGFWDRDDATVFYIKWEGKFYRFVNSKEFDRFLKDNGIK